MDNKLSIKIVSLLLDGEGHARALARELNANHMTVISRLKQLVKENVLDFKVVGRNKVYFLKKTVEARGHVVMAEIYKLEALLKHYPGLRKITKRLQTDPDFKMAIIFGSYAKHNAKEDSDIDLYLETGEKTLKRGLELMDDRLSVKMGGFDPDHVLIKEIIKNHVIIKGVERYIEKVGFFK